MYFLKNISQTKGHTEILKDINFQIPDNSIFAILGPSGSGKTTLLNILAKIDFATAGSFVSDTDDSPKGIMVFQDYRLFPHMDVYHNVTFGLKVSGVKKDIMRKRATEIMEVVGINELEKRYPDELSGGQQQRVSLARALILKPQLLLMDEPFSSLDEGLRIEMLNFVKKLQRDLHLTVIFVTHFKDEAYMIANEIAVLIDGQIMQIASPVEIDKNPANIKVAKFLGQANFIDGELKDGEFISPIYKGKVKSDDIENKVLYLPYSGIVQAEKTPYPAFEGQVIDAIWLGGGRNRLTIQVNDQQILIDSTDSTIEVNHSYHFYFSRIPVIY